MLQYLSDLIDYLSQMPLSLQAVLLTGTVLLILQTVVLGRNARRRLLRLQSQPDQKEMIQDTKRHMMMPPQPSAHLIVTHTDMLFAFLETRFNRPPHTADADQGFRRYVYRRVTQVGLQFTADDVPPQDQPDLWPCSEPLRLDTYDSSSKMESKKGGKSLCRNAERLHRGSRPRWCSKS